MELNGHTDERFANLRDLLSANLESGEELGAAVAVDIGGELVVDLWGGYRNAARTLPWEANTLVNGWSSTKLPTALAAWRLVERGLLDLPAPVAKYWPEFAAAGKEGVEVRHVLAHTSGVSGWEPPFTATDMYDRETATARLAGQAPWWDSRAKSGYHAQNWGHLVSELVLRVTGRTLREFVADDIAGPLEADVQIGVGAVDDGRCAEIVPPPPFPLGEVAADSVPAKTLAGLDAGLANTTAWRRAELGALNGHMTARGLARMMSVVSRGGAVGDVRLLSPETIDLIFEEQANGVDLALGIPLRWGVGIGLPDPTTTPYLPAGERVGFWGGWGGSMTVMLPERGMTICYLMNRMGPGVVGSARSEAYIRAILEGVAA
ncbi:serine hydrolase domain-containing protein [Nocardia carnea]|uniref:serine hydrolase domain-containing protein n=1 Tax=Nocardia carnea TaxID=37328 RepID=UPI0024562C5E|nr:serine hydrolase domain-containing protein [Nocardia carnea]